MLFSKRKRRRLMIEGFAMIESIRFVTISAGPRLGRRAELTNVHVGVTTRAKSRIRRIESIDLPLIGSLVAFFASRLAMRSGEWKPGFTIVIEICSAFRVILPPQTQMAIRAFFLEQIF